MPQKDYLNGLMSFISDSPTPFHAVAAMVQQLTAVGYRKLEVADKWHVMLLSSDMYL